MKKNNKFRGGGSNTFSLNYKFDSVSPAGKYNGTALDLIKRYNDLAKEAHSTGDFVEMEVFRQYAEHYRKVVTEINERRGFKPENQAQNEKAEAPVEQKAPETAVAQSVSEPVSAPALEPASEVPQPQKKSFKVIELSSAAAAEAPTPEKPKRAPRRKAQAEETAV